MRFIENPPQLEYPPRACSVTNRTDGDFIDFQTYLETLSGPHRLYVHRAIIEEAAKLCGMVRGDEVDELKDQLAAFGARFEQLEQFVEAQEARERATQAIEAMTNGEGI